MKKMPWEEKRSRTRRCPRGKSWLNLPTSLLCSLNRLSNQITVLPVTAAMAVTTVGGAIAFPATVVTVTNSQQRLNKLRFSIHFVE